MELREGSNAPAYGGVTEGCTDSRTVRLIPSSTTPVIYFVASVTYEGAPYLARSSTGIPPAVRRDRKKWWLR